MSRIGVRPRSKSLSNSRIAIEGVTRDPIEPSHVTIGPHLPRIMDFLLCHLLLVVPHRLTDQSSIDQLEALTFRTRYLGPLLPGFVKQQIDELDR